MFDYDGYGCTMSETEKKSSVKEDREAWLEATAKTCCSDHQSRHVDVALLGQQMLVCATCGNKRCPKATNCALACTRSNLNGQPGSSYVFTPMDDVIQITTHTIANWLFMASMAYQFNVYNRKAQALADIAARKAGLPPESIRYPFAQSDIEDFTPAFKESLELCRAWSRDPIILDATKQIELAINDNDVSIKKAQSNLIVLAEDSEYNHAWVYERRALINAIKSCVFFYKQRNQGLPNLAYMQQNLPNSVLEEYRNESRKILSFRICGNANAAMHHLIKENLTHDV
jgi:hypothetical protein